MINVSIKERCNLEIDEDIPLLGLVTRLTWQKGIDIVSPYIEDLLSKGPNYCFG